jgi:lipoate-protein ligase A
MKLRFLYSKGVSPEYGAAADAAIFEEVSEKRSPPTLFVYSRNRPTVSMGRFRDPKEDIHIDFVNGNGISVVRRISGGSSVFTGSSQIIYSLTVKDTFGNRQESYSEICGHIMHALEMLGAEPSFKEPNDILADGKKISGSAQYRAKGYLIQHGTLIIGPEPLMDKVLKPVKNRSYGGTVSLEEILGHGVSEEDVVRAVRDAFGKNFMETYDGEFTERETGRIRSEKKNFKVSVSGLSDP